MDSSKQNMWPGIRLWRRYARLPLTSELDDLRVGYVNRTLQRQRRAEPFQIQSLHTKKEKTDHEGRFHVFEACLQKKMSRIVYFFSACLNKSGDSIGVISKFSIYSSSFSVDRCSKKSVASSTKNLHPICFPI